MKPGRYWKLGKEVKPGLYWKFMHLKDSDFAEHHENIMKIVFKPVPEDRIVSDLPLLPHHLSTCRLWC